MDCLQQCLQGRWAWLGDCCHCIASIASSDGWSSCLFGRYCVYWAIRYECFSSCKLDLRPAIQIYEILKVKANRTGTGKLIGVHNLPRFLSHQLFCQRCDSRKFENTYWCAVCVLFICNRLYPFHAPPNPTPTPPQPIPPAHSPLFPSPSITKSLSTFLSHLPLFSPCCPPTRPSPHFLTNFHYGLLS